MGGAFLVSRDIFQNDLWNDPVKFRIFFYIMGNAVFSRDGIEHAGMKLERGQYLRSLRNLQEDLSYREGRGNAVKKYPLTTIQRKLKSLEKEEKITMKSTEYGTLFTVLNYALYQGLDNYKKEPVEQRRNSDGTATEQRWNNNKYVKEGSKNDKEIEEEEAQAPLQSIQTWESNFGMMKQSIGESIIDWVQDTSDELVTSAIKLAVKKGGKTFIYVENILVEWQQHQINTVEKARIYEQDKQKEAVNGWNKPRDGGRAGRTKRTFAEEPKYGFEKAGY